MKRLFVSILLLAPLSSFGESYTCKIDYFDLSKLGKGAKPSKTFKKSVELKGFKASCKKGKCAKNLDLVKTPQDHVQIWFHNAKAPVIAVMLVHMKYNKKTKDYEQRSYGGGDYGNRVYLGSRSKPNDLFVECKFR